MKTKRLSALCMAVLLMLTMSITAFAANSTTATVPVTLTVSNEYRAVNVTVPASFPVEVINGVVVTADNAKITNNAKSGAVKITAVSVTDGAYKVGSYDNFTGSQITNSGRTHIIRFVAGVTTAVKIFIRVQTPVFIK